MRISRKVRISEALLLGVLLLFSSCASPSKPQLSVNAQAEALSHFSLGLLAEANGDPTAAFKYLNTAIQLDPDEEKLYAPAVAVALELKQTNDAVRLAQAFQKRLPDRAESQVLLARVYALTGQTELSESIFRKVWKMLPDDPEAPVFLARLYTAQGRYAEAQQVLRAAASKQPDNVDLLYLLGTLCLDQASNQGETPAAKASLTEAIGLLRQTLELAPQKNPICLQQLGQALLANQQPEEALKFFQEARLYAPADMPLARQMFDTLIQIKNYDEALMIYDQLAAETGTEPELWFQYLAEKTPESDQSQLTAYLEKQIQDQPRAAVFYYTQLGAIYLGAHKNQEAEEILTNALEYYPNDKRLKIVTGYLYLQQERFDDAYAALKQVRTESPETEWSANPFFIFNFLVSAQKSGHIEEAAQTLASTYTNNPVVLNQYMAALLTGRTTVSTQNAIELLNAFHTLTPEAADALYYLMLLQADQKEYSAALETARQLETLAQKNGQTNLLNGSFYYQYAALYERTGKLESAEKLFFKAIETGEEPSASASQNYVAYMWAERGEKLDAGLALIRKALAVDPENGAFLDTLGWIYYMKGNYAEALRELQKAQSVIQDDPTVWEHLGDTWQKLGNSEEASKHWKKALELEPGSEALIQRLKDAGFTPDASPVPADSPEDTMRRP